MRKLVVLVPQDAAPHPAIDAASAIVADPEAVVGGGSERMLHVYFEGNRNRASNLERYEDRLIVAGGRLVERYPTIAHARVPAADFVVVGELDTADWRFTPDPEQDNLLRTWVGGEWRRSENEQLAIDAACWEATTGRHLYSSMGSLTSGDLDRMTPLLRAWVTSFRRSVAGIGR